MEVYPVASRRGLAAVGLFTLWGTAMDDRVVLDEGIRLRQEIQDIDAELARLRSERRLFGRSSFSPEWLILRQRSLQTERERCQVRLRELVRAGHIPARRGIAGQAPRALKASVYALSGIVVVLVVMALYLVWGQGPGIPAASLVPTPSPTTVATPAPTAVPTPAIQVYKVVSGDNLYKIAQQHGVTVEAIVQANKLQDPRLLNVGQELVIPPAPTATPTSSPTATP